VQGLISTLFSAKSRRPRGAVALGLLLALVASANARADAPLFINPATQDENTQTTCPTNIVIQFNAIRYAYPQIVVVHNYTLPTSVNPFGDLGNAANVKPPKKAASAIPLSTTKRASDLATAAISDVSTVETEIYKLRQQIATDTLLVKKAIADGDTPSLLPAIAPAPGASASAAAAVPSTVSVPVADAHSAAQAIEKAESSLLWPMADINVAVSAIRSAQAAGPSTSESSVLTKLESEISADIQDASDPSSTINRQIASLTDWQPVLANVQDSDFTLSHREPCASGAWADNAIVEFVGVDRTLVTWASLTGADSSSKGDKSTTQGTQSGGPGAQSPTPTPSPMNSDTVFKRDLYTAVSPSRLTASHGVGYSNIPQYAWKVGTTTNAAGKNVSQVQKTTNDSGVPFLMTAMVHYRLTNPGGVALHVTFAVTTSGQQIANGMVGVSASLNQSLYVTIGLFRDNTQVLNGYSTNQFVPKGTAITTQTHAVNRFGAALSIPVFSGENGKSSSTPSTKPSPTPTPTAKPKSP
jgi:hypothetical protein